MDNVTNRKNSTQGRSLWASLCKILSTCTVLAIVFGFFVVSEHAVLALSQYEANNASKTDIKNIDFLLDAQKSMAMMQWTDAIYAAKEYLSHNPEGYSRWTAWEILVDASLKSEKYQDALNLLDDMTYEFAGQPVYEHAIALKKAPTLELLNRYSDAIDLYASLKKAHYEAIPSVSQPSPYALSIKQQGDIQYRMAQLFMHEQNFTAAEEKLRACMGFEELPIDHRVQCAYDLAQIQSLTEKEYEAQELLQQLWTIQNIPNKLRAGIGYLLADILQRRQKKDQAKAMFEAVRPIYPNTGVIDMRLKLLK